jgi:DMSO/TMAO reductase YedYZ molybdopterin-dependent catalytic subunit
MCSYTCLIAQKGEMIRTRVIVWFGVLAGVIVTAPLIAIAYLASQFTALSFPAYDVFDSMTRLLPGPLITFGIDLMIDTLRALRLSVVDTAKIAEQLMAAGMYFVWGILAALLLFLALRQRPKSQFTGLGLIAGLIFAAPPIAAVMLKGPVQIPVALQLLWVLFLSILWGVVLGYFARRLSPLAKGEDDQDSQLSTVEVLQLDRRRFLIKAGTTAAAITVMGTGLAINQRRKFRTLLDAGYSDLGILPSALPNASDAVEPAPGTRREYTPIGEHYMVFIQTEPSVVDGETWTLPITGSVDNPLQLTLDDLRERYEPMDQFVTLSCISGRVGTSLIGTTLWTGASLQEVLLDAGLKPSAKYLHIQSADGFYETVDLELVLADRRIMLTYDWDQQPLTVGHGFPLRIYIPDRYGMKQPRWITSIEVIDEYREGYWVERGWDKDAFMQTTSVIDTVATEAIIGSGDDRRVPIGGIAHAGARGISKVEVRIDGGNWVEAELRSPLSNLTWVIWRFEWPYEAGNHLFEVRCVEADGTPQIEQARTPRPSGSRGIHSVEQKT